MLRFVEGYAEIADFLQNAGTLADLEDVLRGMTREEVLAACKASKTFLRIEHWTTNWSREKLICWIITEQWAIAA